MFAGHRARRAGHAVCRAERDVSRVIDQQGRMFQRFNVIDVGAVVVLLVLIPMGFVAYRVFRQPLPVIESIKPSTLRIDSPRRVTVEGRYFRPFFNALVAKTTETYSVPGRLPDKVEATFLIETPTKVEL